MAAEVGDGPGLGFNANIPFEPEPAPEPGADSHAIDTLRHVLEIQRKFWSQLSGKLQHDLK